MPRWFHALLVATTLALHPADARAANPIQLENAKPGTLDWILYQDAAGEIEGYASATSVTHGEPISIFVHTIAPTYTVNIYRVGWYGGLGGRHVHGPVTRTGRQQVMPTPDSTGMVECNWTDPYTLTIPNDWTSGVYLAKLSVDEPSRREIYVMFVVRDDGRRSNHYFQLSVTTYQAYNSWGGKSLYSRYSDNGQEAKRVSFNRPYLDGSGTGAFLWRWEYNMLRFLEREGYDVTYSTNVDTHRRGHLLKNHESFLSIGHDEYWTWQMRDNVEAARNAGVDLGFFSANTAYWQIRLEPSPVTGAPDRTMICYKEDAPRQDPYALDADPSNDKYITVQFRQSPVNRPEAALLGVQYIYDTVDTDIVIDDVTSAPWIFEDTGLVKGSKLPGLLGYEVDAMNQFTPAGTIRLGNSPFLNEKTGRTDYSHMTVHTAASGATVFATGSIQWSWGLDDWNSRTRGSRVNPAAQQMTRNLLRRFAGNNAAADCQFTIAPLSSAVSASAGGGTITLTTAKNCAWTASSSAPWLTLQSAATGSGSTALSYAYDVNPGATRTATITIADQTFTLTQRSCSFSFEPASVVIGPGGGSIDVQMTADNGCAWTAASNVPWIAIASATTGSGSAVMTLSIAPTSGPSRAGVVTAGSGTLTITQQSGCTYAFSPGIGAMSIAAAGGSESVTITTSSPNCPWNVMTTTPWITLTGATSGTGNATVTFTAAENSGTSRDGGLLFNDRSIYYNVYQANGCRYGVAPATFAIPAGGGEGSATVTTDASCHWRASSPVAWIVITSAGSAAGNAEVTWTVQANGTGETRVANLSIAGQTVTVTQTADSCTYVVTPDVVNHGPAATTGTFQVQPSGPCSWTAAVATGSSWLSVTGGANGNGTGTVTYSVAQNNTGAARTGTIRAGSQTFTVTQSGSSYAPMSLTATANGTSVTLTWSAVAGASAYEVQRGNSVNSIPTLISVGTTSYVDNAVVGSQAYVYRVRALSGGTVLTYSNVEIATTMTWTDPSIVAGATPARAAHITQLRTAVNAVRAVAGLAPFSFSEAITAGVPIRALHLQQLREALAPARAVIGLPPLSFEPLSAIRASDITTLRAGVS